MNRCVLLLTTCGAREEAERMAEALIAERLAACVQIAAVESLYRWQGRIEHAQEWRLQIKTTSARAAAAQARITTMHSYALPEIVQLPVEASEPYLAWLEASVD